MNEINEAFGLWADYDNNLSVDETVRQMRRGRSFDYTKWQREYFDEMLEGAFTKAAGDYGEKHPYTGKGKVI